MAWTPSSSSAASTARAARCRSRRSWPGPRSPSAGTSSCTCELCMNETLEEFHRRREGIRREMGGAERVSALHGQGRMTVRDRIDALLDPGTFSEIGTFSRSTRLADRGSTPGDGKIGGHGLLDGRPVTVGGDDVTVKRGSSALIGNRKLDRLFEQAMAAGNPI